MKRGKHGGEESTKCNEDDARKMSKHNNEGEKTEREKKGYKLSRRYLLTPVRAARAVSLLTSTK